METGKLKVGDWVLCYDEEVGRITKYHDTGYWYGYYEYKTPDGLTGHAHDDDIIKLPDEEAMMYRLSN